MLKDTKIFNPGLKPDAAISKKLNIIKETDLHPKHHL